MNILFDLLFEKWRVLFKSVFNGLLDSILFDSIIGILFDKVLSDIIKIFIGGVEILIGEEDGFIENNGSYLLSSGIRDISTGVISFILYDINNVNNKDHVDVLGDNMVTKFKVDNVKSFRSVYPDLKDITLYNGDEIKYIYRNGILYYYKNSSLIEKHNLGYNRLYFDYYMLSNIIGNNIDLGILIYNGSTEILNDHIRSGDDKIFNYHILLDEDKFLLKVVNFGDKIEFTNVLSFSQ